MLCFHRPGLDRTGNALRPQRGEAETALDEIKSEMGLPPDPLWLIVSGRHEAEVYQRLTFAEGIAQRRGFQSHHRRVSAADRAVAAGRVSGRQPGDGRACLGRQGPLLREAALREGFNTNALVLTEELVRTWARAGASTGVVWPTNQVSQWLLKRFVARTPDEWLVMGLVYPATNQVDAAVSG